MFADNTNSRGDDTGLSKCELIGTLGSGWFDSIDALGEGERSGSRVVRRRKYG